MAALTDFFIAAFKDWLSLFTAPFQNADMLWILIPVYLGWAFTEFYQEKKGTSYGNAISNGIIVLWVGIDWTRTTFNLLKGDNFVFTNLLITKLVISALMFAYGMLIIVHAISTRRTIFYIGKIRLVTYTVVMFTPVFYDAVHLTFTVLFAMVIFFPIFYLIVELLDLIIPDPKALNEDLGKNPQQGNQNYAPRQYYNYYQNPYYQQQQYYGRYPYQKYQNYQGSTEKKRSK